MKCIVRTLFAALLGCAAFSAQAQTPGTLNPATAVPSKSNPTLTFDPSRLPPGPKITDWQPRGHAVVGGTLTLTGVDLQVGNLQVVIGAGKVRLPIRVSTSTSTHIDIDINADEINQGSLVVGYANTAATVLDTNYAIAMPSPSIASADAGTDVYPLVKHTLNVNLREFPGASLDTDSVAFGGTCRFVKQSGIVYGKAQRAADLSLHMAVEGYFPGPGQCQLQITFKPLAAAGTAMQSFTLSAPFTIKTPVTYTFNDTKALNARLAPTLTQFGIGSICTGTLPNGNVVGQTEIGADFAIIERGGPGDVSCAFRTKEWILPEGVQLKDIHWRVTRQGNRCDLYGTYSSALLTPLLTRGTVFVKPEAGMQASDFTAFGDQSLIYDGASFATNLHGPRTMIAPMTLAVQCISMAVILQTSSGTSLPTTDPQSFAIVLDSLVLEGPPGLTLP